MTDMNHSANNRYPSLFVIVILVLLISFNPNLHPNPISYAKTFRWRGELISLYNSFRLNIGDRVFNQTLVGKAGWLFFTGDQSIDDYQGIAEIHPGKLVRLQRRLDRLNGQLKEQGIQLLVVIPPNKSTIYRQYMPDGVPATGTVTRLDQFLKYMRENGNTSILDLRPVLLTASQNQQVYFKTDTHWNDLGAFLAYQEIMKSLSVDNPVLAPKSLSDYNYTYVGNFTRDLPPLMGLQHCVEATSVLIPRNGVQLEITASVLPDGRSIRTIVNKNSQLPDLLVYGDSFYVSLAPFVEQHFNRTKSIPFTYEPGVWSLNWIDQEKPDIVIIEIVERIIDIGLPLLVNK